MIVFVLKQDKLMLSSGENDIMSEMNAIRYLSFVYMIRVGFNNKHLYTLITFCLFWGVLLTKYYILVHFAGQKAGFGPLLRSILISLHGNSFKMSQLCVKMR